MRGRLGCIYGWEELVGGTAGAFGMWGVGINKKMIDIL
jgi:hypothetical protein